ncbi:histidine kinase, partial [Clostridium saudiense]|nr:histidine kinase [Clostridium saudiense]
MKIGTKITILFTSCVTIVLVVFLVLAGSKIINSVNDMTYDLNTEVIKSKALDAGLWLNQRISEIRIISQLEEVMNMDMEKIKPYIDRLNDRLGKLYGNDFGTFAIGKTDGLGGITDELTIDISDREYFKEAMATNAEYVLSTPIFSHTDNAPIVTICYPVYNEEGVKTGFINGAISLKKLSEIARSIEFYNCTSWIMDSKGNMYSDQKPDEILEKDIERLEGIIRTSPNTGVGSYNIMNGKKVDKVVFFTTIPNTRGWSLCSMVSAKELYRDKDRLVYTVLFIWLGMLIISIILCTAVSRSISNPINKLTKAIKKMEEGDLEVACDVKVDGNNEISILSRSFNSMVHKIRFLMDRIYEEEKQKRSAELMVLQSQINPHFLYNTLDNLQWKAYDYDAVEIAEMIEALSNFFRISLSNGKEFIPLSQEIKHIENYLFIQEKRYEDILKFTIDFDSSLSDIIVLKLIIQPIVENAIYHGIKPKLSNGNIE